MGQTLTLSTLVHENYVGLSLIDYLCKRFPYRSSEEWVKAIQTEKVVVNDQSATSDQSLRLRDLIAYTSVRNEPAVATDIQTLFEDEYILVVNKPAPLPVHADGRFILHTLIHMLRETTGNPELRLGHRLDRDTSGIVILGKNRTITKRIMDQFEKGRAEKIYLAIVRGAVNFERKKISGWMGQKMGSEIKIRQELRAKPLPGDKESTTEVEVCELLEDRTVLICRPLSGRTNQIRVHLESIGFPILGDKLYGRTDQEFLTFLDRLRLEGKLLGDDPYPRHLLHAWKLTLPHPVTGAILNYEAPLPTDMIVAMEGHSKIERSMLGHLVSKKSDKASSDSKTIFALKSETNR